MFGVKFSQSFVSCSTGDTYLPDFYLVTFVENFYLLKIHLGICVHNNLYFDVNRCDNDGGDCDAVLPMVCPTCLVENAFMRLGDRKCDDDLNNIICCYDKGDCESLTSCPTCQSFLEVLIISPHCSVR